MHHVIFCAHCGNIAVEFGRNETGFPGGEIDRRASAGGNPDNCSQQE
jgi:hypothetical protein